MQSLAQSTSHLEIARLKAEIAAHVIKEGSSYSSWYVGITNDTDRRLFDEHNVNRKNAWWIRRRASSARIARAVERYFLDSGMDGGGGGGTDASALVYAYRKTATTEP